MRRIRTQSTDFRNENKLANKLQNIYIYFQQTFETLLYILIIRKEHCNTKIVVIKNQLKIKIKQISGITI